MENTPADLPLGPRPAAPPGPVHPLTPAQAVVVDAVGSGAGPLSLGEVATACGLHENTVREHLRTLLAHGVVTRTRAEPEGRGRPGWRYAVADEGTVSGAEYAALAAALAGYIERTSSTPHVDAITAGEAWGHDLAGDRPLTDSSPLSARQYVVDLLADVGFAPEPDEQVREVRLTRCPLLDTARRHPDVVCHVHLGLVRGALAEHGAPTREVRLLPFSEPGACRLVLAGTADGTPEPAPRGG